MTREELRLRTSMKWRTFGDDVWPAWVAESDVSLAEPIIERLTAMLAVGDTGYAVAGGLPEAYAGYSTTHYGWGPQPDRVLVVADVASGVVRALTRLTPAGSAVAFLTPSYPQFFHYADLAHRVARPVDMVYSFDKPYEIDFAALEAALADEQTTALLLSHPHNPTGRVFDTAELTAIADLADEHGVRVLSDEVHAQLTYGPARHMPFGALDHPAARASIGFNSASKAWNVAGLKCALAYASDDAAWAAIGSDPVEITIAASVLGVAANEVAFGDPECHIWLQQTVAGFKQVRDRLTKRLSGVGSIGYAPPEATYLAFLDVSRTPVADDPAARIRQRAKLAVSNGADFGPGWEQFVRLNFGTTPTILDDIVDRLLSAVGEE